MKLEKTLIFIGTCKTMDGGVHPEDKADKCCINMIFSDLKSKRCSAWKIISRLLITLDTT